MLNRSQYKDIVVGQGEGSLLGWKLAVYLFVADGLLIDTGPENLKRDSTKFFGKTI